jgi:hypothetical protein
LLREQLIDAARSGVPHRTSSVPTTINRQAFTVEPATHPNSQRSSRGVYALRSSKEERATRQARRLIVYLAALSRDQFKRRKVKLPMGLDVNQAVPDNE